MTGEKEKPLVSVIIIFFNGEKYISEAIESVVSQTYAYWELILADDGSKDGSTEIAKGYAAKYPEKIFYVEHEGHINKGMSATRNLGISKATGDYIALLDSDDVWLPQKLEEQVEILEKNPSAGMVYGKTEIWYSWSNLPEDQGRDHTMDLGVKANSIIEPPTLFLLLLENRAQSPTTCSVIMRREIFERVGYFQDDFRGMFEDFAFFSKVTLKIPVYVSDKLWARYRQHPESCCSVSEKAGKDREARYPVLAWIESYLQKEKVSDQRVWKALRAQLFPYRHENLFLLLNDPGLLIKRAKRKGVSLVKKIF